MSNLDVFRGIVQACPDNSCPVFHVIPVDGGFLLESFNQRLKSARGGLRVFKTVDSAFRYVSDHISTPTSRTVEIRILVAGQSQLF